MKLEPCTCERQKVDSKCVCGNSLREKSAGNLVCFRCRRHETIREHHASNCPRSMKLRKRKKKREQKKNWVES